MGLHPVRQVPGQMLLQLCLVHQADLVSGCGDAGVSLGWGDLWEDAYPVGLVLIMLLLDLFLYAGLAWYLERVIPGQFGPCLPWWFPASKSYWLTGNLSTEDLSRPPPGSGLWEWGARKLSSLQQYLKRTPLQKYIALGQDEDNGPGEGGTQQDEAGDAAPAAGGRGEDMGMGGARGHSHAGQSDWNGDGTAPAAEMLSLRKVSSCIKMALLNGEFSCFPVFNSGEAMCHNLETGFGRRSLSQNRAVPLAFTSSIAPCGDRNAIESCAECLAWLCIARKLHSVSNFPGFAEDFWRQSQILRLAMAVMQGHVSAGDRGLLRILNFVIIKIASACPLSWC